MASSNTNERLADIGTLPSRLLPPIDGYEKVPIVSLEEAVKPLLTIVPKVERNVKYVKECSMDVTDGLTQDESAAIRLYTLESTYHDDSLYVKLNETLRSETRKNLIPWFLYLRLILSGLARLPSERRTVCRGIRGNLWTEYPKGKTFIWWGFSSCTSSVEVLENEMFFGKEGDRTLFQINCTTAKDIKKHSLISSEDEVLLLPARKFIVKSCLNAGHGLHIVQVEEIEPDYDLLEPIPTPTLSSQSIVKIKQGGIPLDSQWDSQGITVAGGNGTSAKGADDQLFWPQGICLIDDGDHQSILIADSSNSRIAQWDLNGTKVGKVVAGVSRFGSKLSELHTPTDVLLDKKTNSLIIADYDNRRVLRWPYNADAKEGKILIDKIGCRGLFLDVHRYLYVSDSDAEEVRRYTIDDLAETKGTIVAGGHGRGDDLNQLYEPSFLFVDEQQNLYVSDTRNHRVMKWSKNAKEGAIVAGGKDSGNKLTQLTWPEGLFVDASGTMYIADCGNHRILRCVPGVEHGTVIVGGNSQGKGANQFSYPFGLAMDRSGNIYVADKDNHRVQMFTRL